MNRMMRLLMLGALSLAASAQTVQVYSEFARLEESGKVLAPSEPREILSPAVARNAFSTYQVAIQVPEGTKFQIFIGENPDDAVKVTLYRRMTDQLEPVGLPYEGTTSQVFWLDVWVDAAAPVRRVKVEPQVYIKGEWVTYPMEVRVSQVVMPATTAADAADPWGAVRAFLCGAQTRAMAGPAPVSLQSRNVRQDLALLAQSTPAQREAAKKAWGGCAASAPADPEAYLRLRDLFFSPAWEKMR
jgi:hypothetical protein